MSALARYFLHEGKAVAGYDRTESALTRALATEGAQVNYEDSAEAIPAPFRNPETTIVVYTPAVPQDHPQMAFFREGGFLMEKRSQMLGHLSEGKYVMAVAGTHGKTTTSTLVAWLNHSTGMQGSAFLGGISKNFGGNLVLGEGNRLAVEADEFDLSAYDYVIDAVDTVTAKLEIIMRAKRALIPVISCMGTAGKLDVTALKVSDVSKTSGCPLARVMRRELKSRGINGVKVVYSEESLATANNIEQAPNGKNTPPSMIFVPATAGLLLAREVVLDIIKEKL